MLLGGLGRTKIGWNGVLPRKGSPHLQTSLLIFFFSSFHLFPYGVGNTVPSSNAVLAV